MALDSDIDDAPTPDSSSTQFIPKPGDEENLWEAEAILAEKGRKYLIRWSGVDEHGKPWADSWSWKWDVTDDLIVEWKHEKERKAKAKRMKKGKGRRGQSTAALDHASFRTRSTISPSKRSSRLSRSAAPDSKSTRATPTVNGASKKRKNANEEAGSATGSTASPRKRRKLFVDIVSPPRAQTNGHVTTQESFEVGRKRKKSTKRLPDESVENDEEEPVAGPSRRVVRGSLRQPVPDELDEEPLRKRRSPPRHAEVEEEEEEEEEEEDESEHGVAPDFMKQEEEESQSTTADGIGVYDEIPTPPPRPRRRSASKPNSHPDVAKGGKSVTTSARGVPNLKGKSKIIPEYQEAEEGKDEEDRNHPEPEVKRKRRRPRKAAPVAKASKKSKKADARRPRASPPESETAVRPLRAQSRALAGETSNRSSPTRHKSPDVSGHPASSPPHAGLPDTDEADQDHDPDEDQAEFQNGDTDRNDADFEDDAPTNDVSPTSPASAQLDLSESIEQAEELPDGVQHPSPTEYHHVDQIDPIVNDSFTGTVIPETQSPKHTSQSSLHPSQPPAAVPSSPAAAKELKPVPVVTPSKFRPHLPVLKPIRVITPSRFRPHVLAEALAPTVDEPVSSIETSETSPKRDAAEPAQHTSLESIEDIEESEPDPLSQALKERGLELGELARARARLASANGITDGHFTEKRTLASILAARELRASDPPVSDAIVQELEDAFVDLDGGAGTIVLDKGSEATADNARDSGEDEGDSDVEEADVMSSLSLVDPQANFGADPHDDAETHTSTTPSLSHNDEVEPPTTPRNRSTIAGSPSRHNRLVYQTPTRQLDAALGMLNHKSEEIATLKNQLEEVTEQQRSLIDQVVKLKADNEWLTRTRGESAAPDNLAADADAQLEAEAAWASEREGYLAEINLLNINKGDLQQDRDFLAKNYELASSYTSELQKENRELEGRASLAEKQVAVGLSFVRSTFDVRVRKLEAELVKAKSLFTLLKERDRRTDDQVRKRAALMPEREAEIERLKQDKLEAKQELGAVVAHRNKLLVANVELGDEVAALRHVQGELQSENRRMRVELARAGARERQIQSLIRATTPFGGDADAEGELDVDADDELVFVCPWGTEGETDRCYSVHPSRQALQDHIFMAGHI